MHKTVYTALSITLIYNMLQNSKLLTKDMVIFTGSFNLVYLKQIMVCCTIPEFIILEKYIFTVIDR